ncbi:hypothetical protein A1O7_05324 [Cladophialophora yegresii CBS 114405]|uniref:Uncharacterized protein n=1 Tax=Cladophialophora yegresii CBS 114405 TaxID=1182544 RepID=W9W077_9EURO|nr:uncharacterized protein A1O7_05324 [Cladophialophora yegresii CBS 114405]EXJ57901.1 hypothetical protein A1O7_05324 [Cladophialophora yegresii CBS 114405]
MAPSRGRHTAQAAHVDEHEDVALNQQSNSALVSARRNFNYLISPTNAERPTRLRTRALLRTVRYVGQFIIWRLVRWAKYIAVGSIVAAVGATAIGGAISGVAWVVAPPSIGAGIVAAGIWGVGRFAARRLHARWKKGGGDVGAEVRERAEDQGSELRMEGSYGMDLGPRAVPW